MEGNGTSPPPPPPQEGHPDQTNPHNNNNNNNNKEFNEDWIRTVASNLVEARFRALEEAIQSIQETEADKDEEQVKLLDEQQPNQKGKNGEEDTEEEEEGDAGSQTHETYASKFNEDTFSFMIVSKPLSVPYITGLMIFALKTSIYCLVLANVIEWNASFNKLNVPVNVSAPVVISQFIAFGITVFTQDDLIMVMILLYEGYHDVNQSLRQVTFLQWLSAVILCSIDALLGLFATFVLIVNSATVLDVLLNFAAVEFVSQLDNTTFDLSTKGFMGRINQLEALLIQELEYTVRRKAQTPGFIRTLGMTFVLLIVGASWLVVYVNQIQGKYAVGHIHIQFDDSTRPDLATHSGFYKIDTAVSVTPGGTRFFYDEERQTGNGEFGFCRSSSRWAFFQRGGNPCSKTGILAQATKIGTFQLTDTGSLPWFAVRRDSFDRIEMPEYQLTEGCQLDNDCGTAPDSVCRRNRCECNDYYTGYQCDYLRRDLCGRVEIDASTGNSFSAHRNLASVYHLVNGTEAYNRPVYLSETGDLLLFTGLRWAITTIHDEGFGQYRNNLTDLLGFIGTDRFHSSLIQSVDMMSEPVWFSTTSDKYMDPRGLQWYPTIGRVSLKDATISTRPDPAVLLCAICNNSTNPCLDGNVCNASGQCQCQFGETGPLCQIPPTGDGKCDQFFNNVEFNYDGGDCCRPTCRSSANYECGTVPYNGHQVGVGYPFCADPSVLSDSSGGDEYIIRASSVIPLSPNDAAPVLSANGRILVLAEPDFDTVRVFDKHTNLWVPRSVPLEGVLRSSFGVSVDVATVPGTILGRRQGILPMLLAVSSQGDIPLVYVYDWPQGATRWTSLPRIDPKSYGLCLGECNVTVKSGVTVMPDQTRVAAVVVNVAEQGGTKNILYVRGTDISRTIGWELTPLVNSDLVSVSLTGKLMVFFNVSSPDFSMYDYHANKSYTGAITIPAEFRSQPNVAINVEAVQLSGNGQYFGCIFRLSTGSLKKAFIQHYFTGLFDGHDPRMDAQYEIPFEFSTARFSTEGDASAAVLTERNVANETDTFRVLNFDRGAAMFELLGELVATDIDMQQPSPTYASISHDGGTLAFGGTETTEVLSRQNLCGNGEVTFRFLFSTDSSPHVASWQVSTIRTLYGSVVTNKMIHQCSNCYSDASFARSEVAELFCVPFAERRCLRFSFDGPTSPLEPNSGYNAFLIEPTGTSVANLSLLEIAAGRADNATQTVILQGSQCEESIPSLGCSESEEEFLVRFLFDIYPQGIEWELRASNVVVWQGGNYSESASTRLERRCLPANTCFNFTVLDNFGDGLCCSSGYGEYVGFLSGKEVFRGGRFNRSESNLFGAC